MYPTPARTGLGDLTRLEWLSLGYLEAVRMSSLRGTTRLRTLQLRAVHLVSSAAALTDALSSLSAVR